MSQPPGPQGPYPQYPGQGQPPSGGFPQQQPGFGPQQGGGYGPPQGPQSGGFQQPSGGFQQPPGGFQQPGYDPYGGGPQKKSPMPWILGGVGALVVIGGVILLIVLLGGGSGPGSTAEDTGKAMASAISSKDIDALKSLSCEADKKAMEAGQNQAIEALESAPDISAEFVSAQENGNKGTATIKMTIGGMGERDIPFPLVKEDDKWLACTSGGMSLPGGGSPPPGGEVPGGEMPGGEAPPPGMPSVPIPPPNAPTP